MCDEAARLDAERVMNHNSLQSEKIVYDCVEHPPMKKDGPESTPYIDDNDQIELSPDENPVDHRKYYSYGS